MSVDLDGELSPEGAQMDIPAIHGKDTDKKWCNGRIPFDIPDAFTAEYNREFSKRRQSYIEKKSPETYRPVVYIAFAAWHNLQ